MPTRRTVRNGAVASALEAEGRRLEMPHEALAAQLKVSSSFLTNVMHGDRCLRVSVAMIWAHALGCDPAVLVRAALQDQVTAAGVALVVSVESEGQ